MIGGNIIAVSWGAQSNDCGVMEWTGCGYLTSEFLPLNIIAVFYTEVREQFPNCEDVVPFS